VLLFDENLAVRLVSALADLYPNCAHVADRGLAGATDLAIWRYAGEQALAIVSKDGDFQQLSVLYGAPPKVIWIRSGNCSTDRVVYLLRRYRTEIDLFLADEEATFLALI
jgi:predicted nuclease of predicted toxin-antitoxin system